jgi:hypothetical protein
MGHVSRARVTGVGAALLLLTLIPSARADTRECVEAADRAQHLRDDGHLRAAREELLKCVVDACPPIVQKDCTAWLAEVEGRLPTVIFSLRDAIGNDVGAVRVLVDGAPLVSRLDGKAVPVDPGEHTFRFEPEQGAPLERRIIVRENDKGRLLSVVLPAAESPKTAPPAAEGASSGRSIPAVSYVLGGVSLIGLAGFAYFWLGAVSDAKDLQPTCAARGCREGDLEAPRDKALVADISLGVGVAAALAAVGFYVFQKRPAGALSLSVVPSREGLGLSAGRTF